MNDNFIKLRVVYEVLPDLIALGISVRCNEWSANSKAYASPCTFTDQAQRLLAWVSAPAAQIAIESGADTGIGWMLLKFYTTDRAGHVFCAVSLAADGQPIGGRAESTWRFSIEMPTELGLVERFARECVALSRDFSREARLLGLPS